MKRFRVYYTGTNAAPWMVESVDGDSDFGKTFRFIAEYIRLEGGVNVSFVTIPAQVRPRGWVEITSTDVRIDNVTCVFY